MEEFNYQMKKLIREGKRDTDLLQSDLQKLQFKQTQSNIFLYREMIDEIN